MPERRPERVAHLVQAELAALFLRANDRRLHDVTVTAVRMSPDLRVARVYVRTLAGEGAREPTLRALARAAHFLRGEVGRALGLRMTPELRFEYDTTPDTARRVDDLLREAGPPKHGNGDDEDGDA
jgi:ribosome-binding factor A